jgi:hypothetical protein
MAVHAGSLPQERHRGGSSGFSSSAPSLYEPFTKAAFLSAVRAVLDKEPSPQRLTFCHATRGPQSR